MAIGMVPNCQETGLGTGPGPPRAGPHEQARLSGRAIPAITARRHGIRPSLLAGAPVSVLTTASSTQITLIPAPAKGSIAVTMAAAMDALLAAAGSHRLVLDNDRVRLLEVV